MATIVDIRPHLGESLTRRERDFLNAVGRGDVPYADHRVWTPEMRSLRAKRLISHHGSGNFTITARGIEVRERVS